MMKQSKRYQVSLILGVPAIFFALTIFTANLTYYATMHYVRKSVPISYKSMLDSVYLFRLQFWVVILALFSFVCGFILIYAITHPIKKLLQRAESIDHNKNFALSSKEDEIEHFCSIFDETLTLLKSHLKEKEMRDAGPLLDRLKKADQLAVLGFLSDRIAHEVRNPLGCIQGFVELMKKDMKEGDAKKTYLDTILHSIKSINRLVEELIEFSQPCSDISQFTDINQVLREALQMVQKEFNHKKIVVKEAFQEDLPCVKTNPEKIHMACLNILRNIFEFATDKEKINVTTSVTDTGSVCIRFCNKRSYIPNEDINRIFVPFFMIQNQRIGLGLSIAQHIISAHCGDIQVENDKGNGTAFMVELPVAKDAPKASKKREMALQEH